MYEGLLVLLKEMVVLALINEKIYLLSLLKVKKG